MTITLTTRQAEDLGSVCKEGLRADKKMRGETEEWLSAVEGLRVLEDAIEDAAGCVLLDRFTERRKGQ